MTMASAPAGPRTGWSAGLPEDEVRRELDQLRADDHAYSDGTVFNSICSEPLALASSVFAAHQAANQGDNRIFPSLPRAAEAVTAMLGALMDHPDAAGVPTSGATEANLLAVLVATRRHTGPGRPRIVLGRNAHFSFEKILSILPVEPVWVELDARLRVDTDAMLRAVGTGPDLVVLSAGTSEAGAVDDIRTVAAHCAERGVRVHVDAASGGFLVPFAVEAGHPVSPCGFGVPGVASIALDPHKYGAAPIPSGHLLVRETGDLAYLRWPSHYHGTGDHHGLLGTRPGGALLATWAALRHLGRDGYRDLAAGVFARRAYLVEQLDLAGLKLAFPPDLMVVGVAVADPLETQAELQRRGLIVSVSRRFGFVRLVVHTHQSTEQLGRLARHLADVR